MKYILLICLMTLGLFTVNTSGSPVSVIDKFLKSQHGKVLTGLSRSNKVHDMLNKTFHKLEETNDTPEVKKSIFKPIPSESVANQTIYHHPAMAGIKSALNCK
ncbi:uncharacterized protein LOC126833879 [Adelges cooleyi]|uniref:uncharacterized protein LOC126833879 n=1 Tax=Adelges cooleyi TaxID=133065 RepID=UPI00217FC30A|nr:uncharacterized protein LOC126833879 [Adelges cooleyi]